MISNVKMIVADIDGTLVNAPRNMMPITREVLNDMHRKGVLFGIASGRPIGDHMRERPVQWNLDFKPDFIIGMNGGQLEDCVQGTYQEFYKLSADTLKEICELMAPTDTEPFIYIGEDQMMMHENDRSRESKARNKITVFIAKDVSELYANDSANILFRLEDPAIMPEIEAHIAAHPSDKYIGYKTQNWLVEFNDPRVNKGVALRKYCEDHGISLDEVMAFGDTSNDNEMLKCAGWSVCLLNGTDDTKACADAVTDYDHNEDGMGRYILDHVYPAMGWKMGE